MHPPASDSEQLRIENATLRRRLAALEAQHHAANRPDIVALLDNFPGMAYRCQNDSDWSMDYVSAGCLALTGYPQEALMRSRVIYAELIHPEDRAPVWTQVQAALAAHRTFEIEYRINHANGTIRWAWERGWGLWSEHDHLVTLEGFITDISAYKQAELALRDNQATLRALLDTPEDSMLLMDVTGKLIACNDMTARQLHRDRRQLVGRSLFALLPAEVSTNLRQQLQRVTDSSAPVRFQEQYRDRWFDHILYPVCDSLQRISQLALYSRDITEQKQLERDLEQLAISDPLTGLFNRRHFWSLAEQSLTQAARKHTPSSALMIDIDYFKSINDHHGHLVGDQVLQTTANRLKDNLRQSDILCRYGGEEFAALLPETDLDTACETAERLRQRVAAAAIETDRGPLSVTISIGVAELGGHIEARLSTLLECADRKLYAAKQGGRNRIAFWTPSREQLRHLDGDRHHA
ncbi:sensor domain-containing diguanylate cyclase [Marichromatium bheemlicum]|uniref:diguanylate cyclase n=1 Tax=Marichromatium bheemlicum TaxID=365339 RepID=A0ABX1IBE1_9GAMM|nr:GGDEF domain-containing protein [Marichromatium bheemlicum]NKN34354.1 diguanylate cyclase [Marichromatium bheemlicum]